MGPKRKNNKNSRGGKGSGKVANRVAQFEAAANAESLPSQAPKLKKSDPQQNEPPVSEPQDDLNNESANVVAGEPIEATDLDLAEASKQEAKSSDVENEPGAQDQTNGNNVDTPIEDTAKVEYDSELSKSHSKFTPGAIEDSADAGSERDALGAPPGSTAPVVTSTAHTEQETTQSPVEADVEAPIPKDPISDATSPTLKVSDEDMRKLDTETAGLAIDTGVAVESKVDEPSSPLLDGSLKNSDLETEMHDGGSLDEVKIRKLEKSTESEENCPLSVETELDADDMAPVPQHLADGALLKSPKSVDLEIPEPDTESNISVTAEPSEAELETEPESATQSEPTLIEAQRLNIPIPNLQPSPIPDTDVPPAPEDDDVEIIETHNVTRVGGTQSVRAKPVLVTATTAVPIEFHTEIDPSTYFSDPDDTVIEQAQQSPATTMSAQRVRVVGGGSLSRASSTTRSAHMVEIGPSVAPPLPETNIPNGNRRGSPPASSLSEDAEIIGVAVVGFHHTRGPEVEYWVGPDGDQSDLWPYLPFQSLPDGSHSFEESVCYFTLLYDHRNHRGPNPTPERDEEGHIIDSSNFNDVTTLFAVSCSRQIATADVENAPEDATRSSIHKSIVVIARKPVFGSIKEKLTVVTRSYFEQAQFDDRQIIDRFYENLVHLFSLPQSESDFQVGISIRDFVYRFGTDVMVLFKALLLEKRILFYGADTDLLCTFQFALISLIPNLLKHLDDCGSPLLSNYETNLVKPTYMQSSNRESMLKFMGLPLHVFAAGGIFNPFVPLQQLDELTRKETQYGLFGSTNQLFLTASEADIIVDIDQSSVKISNADLKPALALSSADKAFIQPIASAVVKSWDGDNKWQPRSLGFLGSDDYLRQQFEDYLLGLLASVKYETYLQRLGPEPPQIFTRDFAPNPLKAFNMAWATLWKQTNNYRIFNKFTDDELFDIVEPAHVATIKNRPRIDAFAEPQRDPPPREVKVKSFFSGFFRRSSSVPETIPDPAPEPSSLASYEATPRGSPEGSEVSSVNGPSAPVAEPGTPEASEAASESPLSPRRLMFWR